jgi:diaminopropionate ammonia-lyase
MTVTDEEAIAVMKQLARPASGAAGIVAGESGGAGLAGLIALTQNKDAAALVGLDSSSRVLLFNTEGATAPKVYRDLTGLDPEEVGALSLACS